MNVRRTAPLGALLAVLLAVPAGAQDPPSTSPRIATGVTAGGADLSGLTVLQAVAKLKSDVQPKVLGTPIILGVAGKPYRLTTAQAHLTFNMTKTAQAALKATKPGAVKLVLSHSPDAVGSFVSGIASKVYVAPKNATLRLGLKKQKVKRAVLGRQLDTKITARMIDRSLDTFGATRTLHKRLSKAYPKTNANDLKSQYSTIVTVDKSTFTLRLFKHLKVVKTYKVAVGQPAYPTPEGTFHIQDKQVNPVWSVPNSPWAGELGGTTVEGGSAANPLKARWMGITDGVGIHGTGEDYSIGSAASHGCIRMHVSDVIALYKRVPVGATVILGHS